MLLDCVIYCACYSILFRGTVFSGHGVYCMLLQHRWHYSHLSGLLRRMFWVACGVFTLHWPRSSSESAVLRLVTLDWITCWHGAEHNGSLCTTSIRRHIRPSDCFPAVDLCRYGILLLTLISTSILICVRVFLHLFICCLHMSKKKRSHFNLRHNFVICSKLTH